MKRGLILVLMFVSMVIYVNAIYCGDNILDEGEFCDTSKVNHYTCLNFSYDGGVLGCLEDCSGYDYRECFGEDICGNGIVDSDELCDGTNVRTRTCVDEGFSAGILVCDSGCTNYDTDGCTGIAEVCGNDIINGTEECESGDFGNFTCENFGFNSGLLGCIDCMISTDLCFNETSFNETEGVVDNEQDSGESNESLENNLESSEEINEEELSLKQIIIYALIILIIGIIISYIVIFKIQK